MVLAADLDIRDLSLGGIRFVCRERITPGSRIRLTIHKEDQNVRLDGTVVRSSLQGDQGSASSCGPMYEVGATFADIDEPAKQSLERIMNLLGRS